jgi:hypothetical protein
LTYTFNGLTQTYGPIPWNAEVYFADLNSDGRSDLVLRSWPSREINGYFNNGNTFSPLANPNFNFGYIGRNVDLYFSDLNGDGQADLIGRAHNLSDKANFMIKLSFMGSWPNTPPTFGPLSETMSLSFADLNGDGKKDLIAQDTATGILHVYYSQVF